MRAAGIMEGPQRGPHGRRKHLPGEGLASVLGFFGEHRGDQCGQVHHGTGGAEEEITHSTIA